MRAFGIKGIWKTHLQEIVRQTRTQWTGESISKKNFCLLKSIIESNIDWLIIHWHVCEATIWIFDFNVLSRFKHLFIKHL